MAQRTVDQVNMARTIYCSFCGRSNDEAGSLMESTDQTNKAELCCICLECARIAVRMLAQVPMDTSESN
jgi:hypothetical protein